MTSGTEAGLLRVLSKVDIARVLAVISFRFLSRSREEAREMMDKNEARAKSFNSAKGKHAEDIFLYRIRARSDVLSLSPSNL